MNISKSPLPDLVESIEFLTLKKPHKLGNPNCTMFLDPMVKDKY